VLNRNAKERSDTVMNTTNTISIAPKYDSMYDSLQAAQAIHLLVDVLGEVIKGNKRVDVSRLPELFESSNDTLLYTLGWLEGQKAAAQENADKRLQGAIGELAAGIKMLVRKTASSSSEVWSLSRYAATYLDCACALEAFAGYQSSAHAPS
jgi:hypothetical protein